MPIGKKTTWAQLRVGLLALFALSLLALLIILLSGENPLFRTRVPVYTYYGDAAAVVTGAPVRLNGILVGKVGAVELSNEADPSRVVRVTLEIDEEFLPAIPEDSTTRLAQTSLLAARYVNIRKGTSAQAVQPGGELASTTDAALEDLFQQGNSTLAALQSILRRVESLVIEIEDGKGTIGRFIRDPRFYDGLVETVDETQKLLRAINNPDSTLGKVIYEDELYNDIRGMIGRVNTLLETVDRDLNSGQGTLSKLLKDPALHDELVATLGDVRETIRLINSGDGTVSRLLNDPSLHNQIQALVASMDQLVGHINSGEGTLGQLLLNPQLYENIDGLTREMSGLMRDFRANPKKFLTIRLTLF
jgi:phospholipid/cholesterol/gamma-HCH transport system substrate-binding protein